MNDSKITLLIPLFLAALSFALNLHALAADSFWGDEILTASFAGRSPAELIHWTAEDIHPPLYYLLAGIFTRLTVPLGLTTDPNPVTDWLWRFPSVIAVVLTVAITYRLAVALIRLVTHPAQPFNLPTPSRAAAFATLLLTFAPVAIKYGQEARMHALFMLLATLSTWLFLRALSRPRQWSRWLAYALAAAAAIYTMYFGFLILASQAILLLLSIANDHLHHCASPSRFTPFTLHRFTGFTASGALIFLLYLPWWPVLLGILRQRTAVGAIEGGVGSPTGFMLGLVEALGPSPTPAAWLFLGLFITGLFLLARQSWPVALFTALWLALPGALPLVLGDPRALQFRYAFILPVYLTVVGYTILNLDELKIPKIPRFQKTGLSTYLVWVLVTLSFIATLKIYQQVKPNWRGAAAYLDQHAGPTDVILIGPLWDEGRFIDYYYRGQAQLLTPAAMVTNIERRAESLRQNGGRIWAVNRFAPQETPALKNVIFNGVVISEPQLVVYEADLLTEAAIDLAAQAVEAAYPWAAEAKAQGVLDPDPRTAQAAALRAWADVLMAAGRPQEALPHYQRAVDIFPGWVNGFIALAEAQQAVGNLPAAAEAYRQAVAYNLNWQGPAADEAAMLVQSGQWETALKKYQLIIGN
jgi:uncharacterized membrane protein